MDTASDAAQMTAVATVFLVIATLALAAVAIWGDDLKACLHHPKLVLRVKEEAPYCLRVDYVNGLRNYELRVGVKNEGDRTARDIEVFAKELRVKGKGGSYLTSNDFLPMRLGWADMRYPTFTLRGLAPDTERFVGIGHILHPEDRPWAGIMEYHEWPEVVAAATVLSLHTESKPNTKCHLLPPGEYQLALQVSDTTGVQTQRTVHIRLEGPWYGDSIQMFTRGVRVNLEEA